jgi:hypothetical protein
MRASAQVAALTALFGIPGNPDRADFMASRSRRPACAPAPKRFATRLWPGGRAAGRHQRWPQGNCQRPRIWRRNAKVFPYLSIQLTMIGDHAESIDLKRAHGRSVVGPGKGCV